MRPIKLSPRSSLQARIQEDGVIAAIWNDSSEEMERREWQRLEDLQTELKIKEDEFKHIENERNARLKHDHLISLLALNQLTELNKMADKLSSQISSLNSRIRNAQVKIAWMRGTRWLLQDQIISELDGTSL